jgi:hypothetical protein
MAIWDALLDFIGRLVSPDWGGIIALLPVIMLVLVVAYLGWVMLRFATAGPTRHGGGRVAPKPPAGVHLPGPSYAPIVIAIGALSLFYGIVFHGPVLVIGLGILVLTLLYWGREAMRDYDRIEPEDRIALPAQVHAGPPAGVHLPGPSFRPIISGLALAILLYGLVLGGALLAVGFVVLAISLVQWLFDARREYAAVPQEDVGHVRHPCRGRRARPERRLSAAEHRRRQLGRYHARQFGRAGCFELGRGPIHDCRRYLRHRPQPCLRPDRAHGTGRTGLHDRLHQRRPRDPPRRLDPQGQPDWR